MTSSDLWTVFLLWSGFDLHEKTVGNARLLEIRKWNEYNPILSERSHWGTIPGNNKSVRISLASVLKSEKKKKTFYYSGAPPT